MIVPWVILTAAAPIFPLLLVAGGWLEPKQAGLYPEGIWGAAWPILCAALVAAAVSRSHALQTLLTRCALPAGDIVYPLLGMLRLAQRLFHAAIVQPAQRGQAAFDRVRALLQQHHGTVLQRSARQETFALGILFMAALALGMAFVL
jgi:hypothetical protein